MSLAFLRRALNLHLWRLLVTLGTGDWWLDILLAIVDGTQRCGFGGYRTTFCDGGGYGLAGARERPAGSKALEFGPY